MNKSEFLQLIKNSEFAKAQDLIQKKILSGEFNAQDLKYLAVTLEKQGKNLEALSYLKIAERVSVPDPELDEILAFTFDKVGDFKNAVQYFYRILARQENNWLIHFKLGECCFKLTEYQKAIKHFINARNINQNSVQIYFGLYKTFMKLEKHKECLFVIEEAIKLNKDSADLYLNAGLVAAQLHEYPKSLNYLKRCIEIGPSPGGYLNLGNLYKQLSHIEKSIETTHKCIELVPDYLLGYQNLCIDYNYYWEKKSKTFDIAKKYGEILEKKATPYTEWLVEKNPQKKIRLGFVSGDFRLHPVSHFLVNILDDLPRDKFDLVAYYNSEVVDSMTKRISQKFTEWNLGVNLKSDKALAEKIHQDRIDILIDLSGHTAKTRTSMFAYKPAPIQVNWLGYFNTTGLKSIDWVIADQIVLTEKDRRYYTEKPYYLPNIYYAYSKPALKADIVPPPHIKNGHITFGCFNNHPKLNYRVIEAWSKILKLIPTSRMIIKNRQLESPYIREDLIKSFESHGIDAKRLTLEPSSPMYQYYDAYNKVDMALDPFPFPGGTTSIDGLWMGVPVVTLSGNTFISRQGETILKNLGMDDWISYSENEYIDLAVKKAKQIKSSKTYKEELREKVEKSPVMNTQLFAKHLSDAFQDMWGQFNQKKKSSKKINNKAQA
jgi:predicted O-linked N-acetylglucosamine transferase (SPINDLY family)